MTQIFPILITCPICEHEFEIYQLASTNQMGSPDLDLRPPEMARSTMDTWTHECPKCGYVASDFNQTPEITPEFVEKDEYKSCDDLNFKSHQSEIFYRQYMISDDNEEKFYSLLHCAWACDDVNDEKNSLLMRNKCLDYIDFLKASDDMMLVKADLMRRSNHFDELVKEYSTKSFENDIYNRICDFQIEKALKKDNGCYAIEDI